MSYSVKKRNETFYILESTTDSVLELSTDEKDSRILCRKLNLGSGFNGWTPSFFLTSLKG